MQDLIQKVRGDFPLLTRQQRGDKPLVYLDAAATTPTPESVIDAVSEFYRATYANVHRGVYQLAEEATAAYEQVRDRVARFVGAPDRQGVVFTKNCTEAINLVARAWGERNLNEGDEVLVSVMEHHSNLVPWQQITAKTDSVLCHLPLTDEGELDLTALDRMIGPRTKLVAISGMSNVLGSITPLLPVVQAARAAGALVLVDGAQLVMHQPVDMSALDLDFLAFSGHKLLGPTGVGVLAARPELLEQMDPFLTGGEMVLDVTLDKALYNHLPHKFEAGTPMIAQVIGLGAAVEYLESLGLDWIGQRDRALTEYGLDLLQQVEGLVLYGRSSAQGRVATFTFNLEDDRGGLIHPHDVATVLSDEGLAIRAGHHCAKPLMTHFGLTSSCRASCYLYNTEAELDLLARSLARVRAFFGRR
jgi:cysteine desulfurase/selenocysteine lyase